MRIADARRVAVRVEIPEKYFPFFKHGLRAKVLLPACNNLVVDGIVTKLEFLFENKKAKDANLGLYSSYEQLGETVFYAQILLSGRLPAILKPGSAARVYFTLPGEVQ